MGTNNVNIKIFNSIAEAPIYTAPTKGLSLDTINIVAKGTIEGKATVDLILSDNKDNQYTAMITGGILTMVAGAVTGVDSR